MVSRSALELGVQVEVHFRISSRELFERTRAEEMCVSRGPGVSLLRLLFNVDGKTPQIWLMLHTNVDEFGSQNDLCPILSGDGNGCLQRSPILCVDGFEEGTLVTPISR